MNEKQGFCRYGISCMWTHDGGMTRAGYGSYSGNDESFAEFLNNVPLSQLVAGSTESNEETEGKQPHMNADERSRLLDIMNFGITPADGTVDSNYPGMIAADGGLTEEAAAAAAAYMAGNPSVQADNTEENNLYNTTNEENQEHPEHISLKSDIYPESNSINNSGQNRTNKDTEQDIDQTALNRNTGHQQGTASPSNEDEYDEESNHRNKRTDTSKKNQSHNSGHGKNGRHGDGHDPGGNGNRDTRNNGGGGGSGSSGYRGRKNSGYGTGSNNDNNKFYGDKGDYNSSGGDYGHARDGESIYNKGQKQRRQQEENKYHYMNNRNKNDQISNCDQNKLVERHNDHTSQSPPIQKHKSHENISDTNDQHQDYSSSHRNENSRRHRHQYEMNAQEWEIDAGQQHISNSEYIHSNTPSNHKKSFNQSTSW